MFITTNIYGNRTSPSCRTFHNFGNPGVSSPPSNPAAIAATACSNAPLPGRYPPTFIKIRKQ